MTRVTFQAFSIGFLDLASRKISHAVALLGEVKVSAEGTHSIGVDIALRISELTFSEGVQEIKSIAVDADPCFVKGRAVFICILTSSFSIDVVSLHAFQASCSGLVILCTILIFYLAEEVLRKGITLLAGVATSVLGIAGAVGNSAGVLFGQCEGILALVASFVIEPEAALDDTSSRFMSEGSIATDAVIVVVILAAWTFLHTTI